MKGKLTNIILILIMIAGISLIGYPTFSSLWNKSLQLEVIAVYEETVQEIDTASQEEMLAAAREYNQVLYEAGSKSGFAEENSELYESLLNTGDGIMGYVNIPSIRTTLPIYHGTSQEVLQAGIGHVEWTSLPVGGEGTHTVLSGHRGLPGADLLTDLDAVKIGDRFSIHILSEVYYYEVDQIEVVLPEDTNSLLPEAGKDYATLVTCTPYGINTHRLLVRGHRIQVEENKLTKLESDGVYVSPVWFGVMTFTLIWIFTLSVKGVQYVRRRKKDEDIQ